MSKPDDLTPDRNNANRGTERGGGLLEDSFRELGAGRSVLVDKHNEIIAGNKTAEAAGALDIPIRVIETDGNELIAIRRTDLDLSEKNGKARRMAYADNRIAELNLDWNAEAIFADIKDGVDFSRLFTEKELTKLLAGIEGNPDDAPDAQMDRAEELREKWGTERGQVWEIGPHRLMCGDATDLDDYNDFRFRGAAIYGAVVTDPPYGIDKDGIQNDDTAGLRALFDNVLAVARLDAVWIVHQSPRLFPIWLDAIRGAGHEFQRMLWYYLPNRTGVFPWRGWVMTSDAILVSTFGNPTWAHSPTVHHDCYSEPHEKKGVEGTPHPTIKPQAQVANLIEHTQGDIFDPFLGSGTTMVAAEQLGRVCYGMEISPAYVSVALERMSDMGLKPKLCGTGANE